MKLNLFVYGTLRKNHSNYSLIQKYVKRVKKAVYHGQLFHLPFGYPAIVEGKGKIVGEVITLQLSEGILEKLDVLEGYLGPGKDNEYERIKGTVTLMNGKKRSCQLYVYPESKREWLYKKAVILSSGDWARWITGEDHIYYFAYGSCMNRQDFSRTVTHYEVLGKASLPHYRVAFTRYSSVRKGGVADIVPQPHHITQGILYRFPVKYLVPLDRREGVPNGTYQRKVVEVLWNGKCLPVLTYGVVKKQSIEMPPSKEYLKLIMDGTDLLDLKYRTWLTEYVKTLKGAFPLLP